MHGSCSDTLPVSPSPKYDSKNPHGRSSELSLFTVSNFHLPYRNRACKRREEEVKKNPPGPALGGLVRDCFYRENSIKYSAWIISGEEGEWLGVSVVGERSSEPLATCTGRRGDELPSGR